MALLDDWLFNPATYAPAVNLPAGLRAPAASPGFGMLDQVFNEPAMAQDARDAAAATLSRRMRRGFGPFEPVVAPGIGMLADLGVVPGPEATPMAGDAPAMAAPDVPLPRSRPDMPPTDLSAVARGAPGLPMPVAPNAPAQAAPAAEGPGFWDRLMQNINDNRSTMLALAGGFAGAPSLGTGMRRAFSAAAPMASIDRQLTSKRSTQNQTVQFLMKRGLSEADARAAAANPALLTQLLKRPDVPSGYRLAANGTLEFIPGGPADPATKRALGDRQNAPAVYMWNDPADPAKGLSRIPGGPADVIQGEQAGRIALMNTAKAELPNARAIFMEGRGPTGTGAGGTLRSYLNVGDIGRAQRSVTTAIEGILRAMTGAAAPHTEVKRYDNLFMPSPFDSRETAEQKLNALERFMGNMESLLTKGSQLGLEEIRSRAVEMTKGAPWISGSHPLQVNESRQINGVTIKRLN